MLRARIPPDSEKFWLYWGAGSGLTFGHELSKKSIYGCPSKGTKEEFESECQT
jgi:hypothetical protein